MAKPSHLDPMTKELIYAAVSIANNCDYCIHSHTAAARAKGMSDEQYAEFLSIVSLAGRTNHLLNGIKVLIDPGLIMKKAISFKNNLKIIWKIK